MPRRAVGTHEGEAGRLHHRLGRQSLFVCGFDPQVTDAERIDENCAEIAAKLLDAGLRAAGSATSVSRCPRRRRSGSGVLRVLARAGAPLVAVRATGERTPLGVAADHHLHRCRDGHLHPGPRRAGDVVPDGWLGPPLRRLQQVAGRQRDRDDAPGRASGWASAQEAQRRAQQRHRYMGITGWIIHEAPLRQPLALYCHTHTHTHTHAEREPSVFAKHRAHAAHARHPLAADWRALSVLLAEMGELAATRFGGGGRSHTLPRTPSPYEAMPRRSARALVVASPSGRPRRASRVCSREQAGSATPCTVRCV